MQRSPITRSKWLGGLLFVLLGICWLELSLSAVASSQVLHGHVPLITKNLTPSGRLDAYSHLSLAIGLPLRNREQLTNLMEELYEPSSPNYRHFLSADEFAASFGPTEADYQAVTAFAQAHGLKVTQTHPNRTLLDVNGSVSDIEKAFHIKMLRYQHPTEARTFFAPDAEPSPDLDTPLLMISGLDNYKRPRPQVHILGGGKGGGGGGGGGSGSGGSYMGYDFRAAYAAGVSLQGNGQSLGLFELTGYDPNDISGYLDETGLPGVPLQNIMIDGFDGNDTNIDYAVEATVDIEMAQSMAPNLSSILVYEGPTPLDVAPLATNVVQDPDTTAQINDVFNRMATDNLARQLSCSYQMDLNLSTLQIFQQFAVQGQSFFQASGDSGAYAGAIDEPADNPYLTVVGGTTLSLTGPVGSWLAEKVWLTPASYDILEGYIPEEASGGGISLAYPAPPWQQGISIAANQGSTTMRNLPDVAAIADNIDIVWGDDYIGEPFDFIVSGTSLATPLWAGFMALVNEQAAANGQAPVGFANPALYSIGKSTRYTSCFHDITSGNNFTADSPTKYSATSGYDLCTGWGTIIGSNMIAALLAPPADSLVVTPPVGFTSSGPGGGPYTKTSENFMLTNAGHTPIHWGVFNTSPWLSLSTGNGNLSPGQAATVTVSLNSTASSFLIGNHSGNIVFSNLTAGSAQSREIDLYVANGGFETGDFTYWTLNGNTDLDFALAGDDVDVAGTNALDGESDWFFVHSGIYGAYLGEYPNPGSLSQIVATTAGRQYLVSFWLTSVPYEGSTTPNDFAAVWEGNTLFEQTNLPAFGWTNMQYVVPATSSRAVLEFLFDDIPGAFGLDDVTVEPLPAPAIQSVALSNGIVTLTWSSVSNLTYQIQAAGKIGTSNWANLGPPITASASVTSATEAVAGGSQQFYRVTLLP